MRKFSNLKKIQNSEAWRRRLKQVFRYLEQSKDIKQNRYLPFCDFDVMQKIFWKENWVLSYASTQY